MISLQEWMNSNRPKEEMFFREAFWEQMFFVRDTLTWAMSETRDQVVDVVGTHTSKSIKLPVYHLKNSKFELWFRNNFHDWSITAHCQHPVDYEFCGVLMKEDPGRGCCFEGMDKLREPWYRPQSQMTKFSTVVFNDYDFYLFIKTLCHAFGVTYERGK